MSRLALTLSLLALSPLRGAAALAQLDTGLYGVYGGDVTGNATLQIESLSGNLLGSVYLRTTGLQEGIIDTFDPCGYDSIGQEEWRLRADIFALAGFVMRPSQATPQGTPTLRYDQALFPEALPFGLLTVAQPDAAFEVERCDAQACETVAWLAVGEDAELAWYAAPALDGDRVISIDSDETLIFTRLPGLPTAAASARTVLQAPL
ncbi:MAG: hypothetical protein H6741_25905 [Alphaproteobacteria bacterium]|nr:hypothetical protein [Alphaproteobacteria bacterium]